MTRHRMASMIGALVVIISIGCATAHDPGLARAMEADEGMVEGCQFLGSLSGHRMPWGDYQYGRARAVDEVAIDTAAMGGTHFVVTSSGEAGRGGGIEVSARAYRCGAEPGAEGQDEE